MLLGLVSDTHDNHALSRVAAAFFRERRCARVIHLGDVMSDAALAAFEGMPLTVIRGNNDPRGLGADSWEGVIEGVRVYAHHGHRAAAPSVEPDLLLHGHTHRFRNTRVGRTLVVNPGALHRASPRTVALVELLALDVRFFEVREDGVRALAH